MKIYSQEAKDGLRDILLSPSHGSILFNAPIKKVDISSGSSVASLFSSVATNMSQQDLYYLATILVSTVWNINDDVFTPEEVWAARDTAEDKPFNLSHNPNKIIGHITENYAVDPDYTMLDNSLTVDELPASFHLLTSAVIYRHLKSRDPALTEEIATLIEEIENDEWFVSMECLFPAFDYALQKSDGSYDIVPRNKETAYHTKHLRVYGGSGEFGGRKLGRVLRNITFSGKGLVKKPANPESIIFTTASEFGVINNRQDINGEITMADDNKITELEKQNSDLVAQVASLELQIKNGDVAAFKSQLDTMATDLKSRDTKIGELETQVSQIIDLNATIAKLTKDLELNSVSLAEKTESLQKIQADILRTNRVTTLVDKGVDKTVAESIVDKFATLADEQFNDIVAMQNDLVVAKKCVDDKMKGGKADEQKPDEDLAEKSADASILETTEVVIEPELNTTKADDDKETLQAALAEYFKS